MLIAALSLEVLHITLRHTHIVLVDDTNGIVILQQDDVFVLEIKRNVNDCKAPRQPLHRMPLLEPL